MSSNVSRAKAVDLIGLVYREPRTVPQLVAITGMNKDNVRAWLNLLVEEGLVHETRAPRTGRVGQPGYLYTWNKS